MVRRAFAGLGTLLALPLALFAATPSVQWCSGPPVPLSAEGFAACLVSEITGCPAGAACEAAACAAADDSPSCPPSLACEDVARVPEGESTAEAATCDDSRPDAGAPPASAGSDRAFCVGDPAGGPGLRPSNDDDSRPLGEALAAGLRGDPRPMRDAGVPIAAPPFEPIPDPPGTAAPIRGPPRA